MRPTLPSEASVLNPPYKVCQRCNETDFPTQLCEWGRLCSSCRTWIAKLGRVARALEMERYSPTRGSR